MTDLTAGTGGSPARRERVKRAKKPRKTYSQDWSAYNRAQAHELRDFYRLAVSLCRTIPDELSRQKPRGRHRVPLADLSFVAILNAYLRFPGRILGAASIDDGFLLELYKAGLISRPMCWNSVGTYLRDEQTAAVLQYLSEASALPLVPVEKGDISFDSTIIDAAVRVKKGDKRYRGQKEHRIMKLHLATGNLSNVVTACAIELPGAGEAPLFPGLLYQTAKAFPVKNAFGDAAYRSIENYAFVKRMGVAGWLAFHEDDTGAGGGHFEEIYHWSKAHWEEWRAMYFLRNNVETTFSSFKRVLAGGIRHKTATLRNRKEVSLKNEIYAMVVAYNLRVVIRHIYKVGIEAKFLPGETRDPLNPH